MAQPDWSRGDLSHELQVEQVDPMNLTTVRGMLDGVRRSGSFDIDYYSDTRVSAKIETFVQGAKDNWDGSAALRLVHVVSDYTGKLYRETLGTFYVMDDPGVSEGTAGTTTSYALSSTLKGIEASTFAYGKTINKGASILAATKRFVTDCYRRVRDAGSNDTKASSPIKYEQGATCLHGIHDSANRCNNRISVDPDGTIVVGSYVAPSRRAPDFYVDAEDERTPFIGPWAHSDNSVNMPERVVVAGQNGQSALTGVATVATGSRSHHNVRGYSRDDFRSMSSISPFTQAKADSLAKSYLDQDLAYEMRASHSLMYRPLREGMVECLTIHGETRRWQIASASLNLGTWVWSLDLKGGWK